MQGWQASHFFDLNTVVEDQAADRVPVATAVGSVKAHSVRGREKSHSAP